MAPLNSADPNPEFDPGPHPGPELVPVPQPAGSSGSLPIAHSGRVLQFPAPAAPVAPPAAAAQPRVLLLLEFAVLYIGGPLAVRMQMSGGLNALEMLWLAAAFCLALLLLDPTFDRRQLWNAAPLKRQLPQILGLYAAGVAGIAALVHAYAPHLLFGLARRDPYLLALILITYPIVSVLPQTLVYRVFLFHRYRPLLRMKPNQRAAVLIVMSGLVFCFSHLVFRNWVAPALTLPGGMLFATRYHNTRSLCVSSVEHALYGCFLFAVGLGHFFGMV
jgi:hypothetical protein